MGDAGNMGGASADILTITTPQTVTGAKTFQHQKLILRNRADTASLTLQNPVFTGAKDMIMRAGLSYYIFIDVDDSNKIKAMNGNTFQIDYNHATDAGSVINSAIDAIVATTPAGGTIRLAAGTFNVATTIVAKNYIEIIGEGYSSILKAASGLNNDVIKSFNFDTLTGGNTTGGVHSFFLRDLAIDGNRANTTSGHGIRVYGYGHFYDNIVVYECSEEGIYSEWSTNTAPPAPHSMETVFNNVKVHGCDTVCIRYRGSHDSHWYNVVAYAGTLGNCVVESSANYDGGLEMHACHFWGSGNGVASLLVTSASVGGFPIISEGSHVGGVGVKVESGGTLKGRFIVFACDVGMILNSQNNEIDVYSYGNGLNGSDTIKTGIEVNSSFNTVRGRIENNVTYGLNFTNGGGTLQGCTFDFRFKGNGTHVNWTAAHTNCNIRAHIITDTGETAVAGTINAFTNSAQIYSVGAGTNYLANRPETTNMVIQSLTGVAETLKTWQVDDDTTSFLKLENASASNAIFIPRVRALSNLASSSTALAVELRGEIRQSSDTGATTPIISLDSRLHTSTAAVVNRSLVGIRNNGTGVADFFPTALTFADGYNMAFNATTGTKIGTATTQKLGFFGKTPIVQPAANPDTSSGVVATVETEVNQVKQLLRDLGLMA